MAKRTTIKLLLLAGIAAAVVSGLVLLTRPAPAWVQIVTEPAGARVIVDESELPDVTPTRCLLGSRPFHVIKVLGADRSAEVHAHCSDLGFKAGWLAYVHDVEAVAGRAELDGYVNQQVISIVFHND